MPFENVLAVEALTAIITHEGSKLSPNHYIGPDFYIPYIVVSSEVVHHVTLGAETEPALLRAGERAFTRMDQHVCAQILLLREGLAAPRGRACIWLRAKVNVHVRPVPVQPVKRLLALVAAILLRMFLPVVLDLLLGNRWLGLQLVEVLEQAIILLWVVRLLLVLLRSDGKVFTAASAVVRVRGLIGLDLGVRDGGGVERGTTLNLVQPFVVLLLLLYRRKILGVELACLGRGFHTDVDGLWSVNYFKVFILCWHNS